MGSERKSDAYRALARDTFPRSATNSWHFPLALPPVPVQGRASSWRAPRGGRRVRHGKDANSVLAGWFEPMKSSLVSPDEVCGWGQKDAGNLPVATVSLRPRPPVQGSPAQRSQAGADLGLDGTLSGHTANAQVRPIPVCYTGRLRSSPIAPMELAVAATAALEQPVPGYDGHP